MWYNWKIGQLIYHLLDCSVLLHMLCVSTTISLNSWLYVCLYIVILTSWSLGRTKACHLVTGLNFICLMQDQTFQNDIFYLKCFESAIFLSIAYSEQQMTTLRYLLHFVCLVIICIFIMLFDLLWKICPPFWKAVLLFWICCWINSFLLILWPRLLVVFLSESLLIPLYLLTAHVNNCTGCINSSFGCHKL